MKIRQNCVRKFDHPKAFDFVPIENRWSKFSFRHKLLGTRLEKITGSFFWLFAIFVRHLAKEGGKRLANGFLFMEEQKIWDVCLIGCGIIGSATAYSLVKNGCKEIIALEQVKVLSRTYLGRTIDI